MMARLEGDAVLSLFGVIDGDDELVSGGGFLAFKPIPEFFSGMGAPHARVQVL